MIKEIGWKANPEEIAEYMVRVVFGKKISKPNMLLEDRLFLENLYLGDVLKLQKILERRLPWSFI